MASAKIPVSKRLSPAEGERSDQLVMYPGKSRHSAVSRMASARIPVSKRLSPAEGERSDQPVMYPGKSRHSAVKTLGIMVSCALLGVVFGFAVEKGRVFEPEVVYGQMLFRKFNMLKMFLSATISGMFFLSVLSMLPFTRDRYLQAVSSFLGCIHNKGYMTVVVGGAMLGSGMAIGGTCPGVLLAQVGTGTGNAGYTLLGCLWGAILYGFMEPFVTKATKPAQPIKYKFLYRLYGSPYFVMALPVAAALSVMVFSLELIIPWEQENEVDWDNWEKSGLSKFSIPTWPPFVTGVIVGSIQLPLVLMLKDTIGGSSGYCTISSQIFFTKSMKKFSPYLIKYQTGLDNWWQVIYIASAMLGAYLSSSLSGRYGTIQGVSIPRAFVGGTMIVFGSRMAGGCTSGHGLSGMGLLNLLSIATVAAMFGGGMVTANIMELIA